MAGRNLTNYESQGLAFRKRVWFDNQSAAVYLRRGTGVCYNYAYVTTNTGETDTDSWAKRSKAVRLPDTTNHMAFAGVVAQDYGAISASTDGRWIDIFEPGSICEVMVGASTTIDTGVLTCSCSAPDKGIFSRIGLQGRGSMTPLQTVSVTDSNILGGAAVSANLVVTETGIGTSIGATADVGDYVMYIETQSITGTGVADATGAVGKYNLAYTTANTVTLTSTGSTTDDNATTAAAWTTGSTISHYVVPKAGLYCLAYLHDGFESGLQEVLSCDYGVTNHAMMAGGTTHFNGDGLTLAGATATAHLSVQPAKSNSSGLKYIVCEGGISTTTGITLEDGSVSLDKPVGTAAVKLTQAGTFDEALIQFNPGGTNAIVLASDMTLA